MQLKLVQPKPLYKSDIIVVVFKTFHFVLNSKWQLAEAQENQIT